MAPTALLGLLGLLPPSTPTTLEVPGLVAPVHTFPVQGDSLQELRVDAARDGWPAQTDWSYSTTTTTTGVGAACRIDTATVRASARVRLPEWQPEGRPRRALRRAWLGWRDEVIEHERVHMTLVTLTREALETALIGQPCDRVQAVSNEVYARGKAWHVALDDMTTRGLHARDPEVQRWLASLRREGEALARREP